MHGGVVRGAASTTFAYDYFNEGRIDQLEALYHLSFSVQPFECCSALLQEVGLPGAYPTGE